ncbi:MAG: hypothetical protein GXY34_01540 [Syntrophomonadaceae bacterium]|nr:hypothetical protein [Syntrophomonadaceae bacterium]
MASVLYYILILFVLLFIFLALIPSLKQKAYYEILVATCLFLIGLSYGVDYALQSSILPNPNKFLAMFKPVYQAFSGFFEIK